MTCADCGKPLDGQVCETDNPRPGRITVSYQGTDGLRQEDAD